MIDTFSGSRKTLHREPQARIAEPDVFLAAAMRLSGAVSGQIARLDAGGVVIRAMAAAENGQLAPLGHDRINPRQSRLIERALATGRTVCADDGGPIILCTPVASSGHVFGALCLEAAPGGAGFAQDTICVIELLAAALACESRAVPHLDRTVAAQTEPLDGPRMADRVERSHPADLSDSTSFEVNDMISAISAHAAAGLQWLDRDTPDLEKAQCALRKILSSAAVLASTIASRRPT